MLYHSLISSQQRHKMMDFKCPRQESNLRTRFRKPMLYPLSYGSATSLIPRWRQTAPRVHLASVSYGAEVSLRPSNNRSRWSKEIAMGMVPGSCASGPTWDPWRLQGRGSTSSGTCVSRRTVGSPNHLQLFTPNIKAWKNAAKERHQRYFLESSATGSNLTSHEP